MPAGEPKGETMDYVRSTGGRFIVAGYERIVDEDGDCVAQKRSPQAATRGLQGGENPSRNDFLWP
jgi:hypothetical protein